MLLIISWIGICFAAFFVKTVNEFYGIAFAVGMVMGGIQSLSRSTYSKLLPFTEDTASYFSFYDVCEKWASSLVHCHLDWWPTNWEVCEIQRLHYPFILS